MSPFENMRPSKGLCHQQSPFYGEGTQWPEDSFHGGNWTEIAEGSTPWGFRDVRREGVGDNTEQVPGKAGLEGPQKVADAHGTGVHNADPRGVLCNR